MVYIIRDKDLNADKPVCAVFICRPDRAEALLAALPDLQSRYARARGFSGEVGQMAELPGEDGQIEAVLMGAGSERGDEAGPIQAGKLGASLPEGHYSFRELPPDWSEELAATGWGLGAYKFDRYRKEMRSLPALDIRHLDNKEELASTVRAVHWGRDLINTPASDMGPEALEGEAVKLAKQFGAQVNIISGDELAKGYPMIHAVGKAAEQGPRLVELHWGDERDPKLALAGKGITFDTGGLNIKSASGARIMKKDMGGSAHALALARMIMAADLPIRLHVLLAIAENSISGAAMRPGDVLSSRLGKTVEVDNTDAEGRLVLGDALTRAGEEDPDLVIDFATLTGAARVALGPALPPFFANRDGLVAPLLKSGTDQHDPLWNLPLWAPYLSMLNSPIADLKNAGGSFAGCITAALFLQEFVGDHAWMHFDVYGWNPSSSPGHPAGGEIFAVRGIYNWLKSGALADLGEELGGSV